MKKVLIITYYWPPSGGPGVQRALKFAKYLPSFGWQPIILTVRQGEFPQLDETLVYEIPMQCRVYRSSNLEPFLLYKKLTGRKKDDPLPTYILNTGKNENWIERILKWIRLNIFIPDAKIGWIPFAVSAGLRIIKKEKIDLIFSTSPPHTVQIIAKNIARLSGLKWIADFRDPWMEIVYYQNLKRNPVSVYIDHHLEKSVLNQASVITAISPGLVNTLQHKVNRDEFRCIFNGFDPDDFMNIKVASNEIFTIAYSGFLSEDRIPYPLLPALQKFKQGQTDFRLKLIGTICEAFLKLLQEYDLMDKVELINYLPHKQLLQVLANSDALLLVIDKVQDNQGFITGKIFDYLGCKKPIFGIGPVEGDAARILSETGSGLMLDYEDHRGVYDTLVSYYREWEKGITQFLFRIDPYSREHLTGELVALMDQLSE